MNDIKFQEIKEKAIEEHIPIIMDETLEVLEEKLKDIKLENILEIGTAVGYSAICFSKFLKPNGQIDTIERDEERVKTARQNIKDMGLDGKINIFSRRCSRDTSNI